jgi:hypothetical protein
LLDFLKLLELLCLFGEQTVFFRYKAGHFSLVLPLIVIFLHNHLGPHFFQILLKYFIIPILFSHVVSVYQNYVSQTIIKNCNKRIDFVVVELIVEFAVDEALAVGEGDLVDEDDSVFGDGDDVATAGGGCQAGYLAAVDVEGLLDDVVEDRVEYLQATFLSAPQNSRHSPLAGQPAETHKPEPAHCEHLLHSFLLHTYLPDYRFAALDAGRQQRLRSLLVDAAAVSTVALGPLPAVPLLVLSPGVTLLPLSNGAVNAH